MKGGRRPVRRFFLGIQGVALNLLRNREVGNKDLQLGFLYVSHIVNEVRIDIAM